VLGGTATLLVSHGFSILPFLGGNLRYSLLTVVMKYLYRPTPNEELSVQGRYTYRYGDGTVWASEAWERYRMVGGAVEAWRAEWNTSDGARRLLSHALLTDEGLERLKLRLTVNGQTTPTLTLTTETDGLLVSQGESYQEVALPPIFGVVTPLLSLARLGLPFDVGENDKQLFMTYLLRPQWQPGTWLHRPTKFGYFPAGLREVEVRGQPLKGKGWRMEVPGIAPRTLWFDRSGTVLYAEIEDSPAYQVQLTEYRTFG
jgi:hypothetical protein